MLTRYCNRLDLTAASRAHILEPQWNPSSEEQALDRIHRMGQMKPVETYRYIVKHSIDEVSTAPTNYPWFPELTFALVCNHLAEQKVTAHENVIRRRVLVAPGSRGLTCRPTHRTQTDNR